MTVPENSWIRYINTLSAIHKTAAKKFTAYLSTHDISTKAGKKAAIDYAAALAEKYGESAAAMSCEMYDAIAAASGISVPAAEPAPVPKYGEVAKAVNGMVKQKQSAEAIGNAVGRLVKRTGADTTLKNARRDGAEFAWVPHGDTCSFCLMLASNGWQKASKKTIKGDHAEHIHANCDCTFAIRFDGKSKVGGYDPDRYKQMYDNAEGDTWQEKLNSMRRDEYAANADKIREQKREAYERRKEINQAKNKLVDRVAKGPIIEGSYDPADIYKAITQETTNFVIKDINHPDSVFAELCEKIKPMNGFYDIKMHGSPELVKIYNSPVDANELARIILMRADYSGGPIRLLSCETGKIKNGTCIAKELSNLLGVDVMAPTEELFAHESGRVSIEDENGVKGWMRLFHPGGDYEDNIRLP